MSIESGLFADIVVIFLAAFACGVTARALRPHGVLQLMFKNYAGIITVFGKDYGVNRTFQLYDECDLLGILQRQGMELMEAESPEELWGFLYFTNPQQVGHCRSFARKEARG